MAKTYDTREDTNMRLNQTICTFDGKPYYVRLDAENTNKDALVGYCMYPHNFNRMKRFKVSSPLFSYRSPELGYFYYQGKAHYLSTTPSRRQKQGLCSARVTGVSFRGDMFTSSAMGRCIAGVHKNVDEAMQELMMGAESVPIHRHLAIERSGGNYNLMFRGRPIAYRHASNEAFTLYDTPETSFLAGIISEYNIEGLIL